MNPPTKKIRFTLDDIFQTACDLPPARRAAYLDEACASDPALRRKVESMLRHDDEGKDFLENPAVEDAFKAIVKTEKTDEEPRQPMIGRQIGNYRVQALLGRGGMGEVYLARDSELGFDVVIKLLREEFKDDPEWMARFNREGRLNAELNHPNIAGIRYKGEVDGRQFLVFEFVAGETLEARLKKGALPIKQALPLFSQLAEALGFAHGKGIIHRDLKPANLMLTPDGQLKVLDFGIAKKVTADLTTIEIVLPEDELTTDFGKTRRGEVMGTVVYMSPEQTRGEPLDHRTDLWSFGCVLYETLTGKRPFGGVDTYDTLNVIRTAEPDWQALPDDTPKPIRKLLRQCFAKGRSRRLSSAAEIWQTIEEYRNPAIRLWKRIATAASVLLAIALPVIVWLLFFRTPTPIYMAVLPFRETGQQQVRIGAGLSKSLRDSLATIRGLKVLPYSGSSETNAINVAPDVLMKAMSVNWLLSGSVELRGEEVEVRYVLHSNKLRQPLEGVVKSTRRDYARLQNELASRVSAALNSALPNAAVAVKFADQEKYLTAVTLLQNDLNDTTIDEPIRLLEELAQTEPEPARVKAILARTYLQKASLTDGDIRSWVNKAIKASEEAIGLDANSHEVKVTNGVMLAFQAKTKEDRAKAIGVLKAAWEDGTEDSDAALELARTYEEDKQDVAAENVYLEVVRKWPGYWGGHNELSVFYMLRGRFKEAQRENNSVLTIDPNNLSAAINSGAIQFELGEYAASEQTYRVLFDNRQDLSQSDRVKILAGIGIAQFFQERFVEASETFNQASKLDTDSQEPVLSGYLGDALSEIGGESRAAYAAYSRAIGILRDNSLALDDTAHLAELYAKRSRLPIADPEQAAKDRQSGLNAIDEVLNPNRREVELQSDALYSIIKFYLYLDDLPNAVSYTEKALEAKIGLAKLENDPQLKRLRQESGYQQIAARFRPKT